MHVTTGLPKISVSGDGRGVVSHVGARLLADVAARSGLSSGFSQALAGTRSRRGGHDPGRVLTDLAVMLADGGEAISDLAVLREQHALFGSVASTATAWRVLDTVDDAVLSELRAARATARERAWLARADNAAGGAGGAGGGGARHEAGGRWWPGLRVMLDATVVIAHSEKAQAAPTFKGSFGFHPLTAWLDNTGEALAAVLRPGNAGANNAADHITVTDRALAQIPDAHRHGTPILVSADGAGATKAWLSHLRGLRASGMDIEFSVGFRMGDTVQAAILALPARAWTPAVDADGGLRDGADVAELTGLLPGLTAAGWPPGMRVIVRRERPHPGAQLTFSDVDGWRFQAFATDTQVGQARAPGGPAPRPRPRRGPHPLRQRHRPRPHALPRLRDQHRLARAGPHRV